MIKECYNISILDWPAAPEYSLIWTDPPWEQSALNMFQTMMRKQTGIDVNNKISDLIEKLARLADVTKPLFIEYSVKGHELVIEIMKKWGHQLCKKIITAQANGKPFIILSFNNAYNFPEGLKGFENITHAIEVFHPQVIFDPFAGIGQTARTVIKSGCGYIGSEINPHRYKSLLKILS